MAQRFDPGRLKLTGEAVRVADEVAYNPLNGRNTVTVSDNGVLAYRTGTNTGVPLSELIWFDREGKRIGSAAGRGFYMHPRLSPDEQRIVVNRLDFQQAARDLWIIDVVRSTVSRLTFGTSNQTNAVWSPDGGRIVFTSDRDGAYGLYEKLSNGAAGEQVLLRTKTPKTSSDWSADGRFIAYEEVGTKESSDLWVLPLFGDRKPIPFLRTEFNESQGRFSPDGRWMAYVSDESGRKEIYVQTFPPSGAKWQISTDGGNFPNWRGDGKELFYMAPDQKLMSVEVRADSTLLAGKPRALFEARYFNIPIPPYTVSSDGRRFLIVTPVEEESNASPLTVVLSWTAELKRK
jgi:Tol biopolymer transport system component